MDLQLDSTDNFVSDYGDLQPLSLKHLHLIKWVNDGDKATKKLKLAETIAPKWRNIARLVGLNYSQIASIEDPGSRKTLDMYLDEVVNKWQELTRETGRTRTQHYPYTWEGLLELLSDMECKVLAADLKKILASGCSTIKGNLRRISYKGSNDDLPLSTKCLHLIKWSSDVDRSALSMIKIAETIAPKWRDIAKLIGLNHSQIASIENPGSGKTPGQCLDDVFKAWQEDSEPRQIDYSFTWHGLLELLEDAEYTILAGKVKEVLANHGPYMNEDSDSELLIGSKCLKKLSRHSPISVICKGMIFLTVVLLFIVGGYVLLNNEELKLAKYTKTLPSIPENFVGREAELNTLLQVLDFEFSREKRIINIIGSPGFGKSALALKLGHSLIVKRNVHVNFVNMADFPTDVSVKALLAEKILRSTARRVTFDKLLEWTIEIHENTVIILDNCDDVLFSQTDELKNAIFEIVKISTKIKLIITSRKIVLQNEFYYWHIVSEFTLKEAVLFLDQALYSVDISVNEKEAIANLTGKVPLALRTVCSLLLQPNPPSPVSVIEDLNSSPLKLLSPKELPSKQRLNVIFNVSFGHLSEDLQLAAQVLAFFPGSFDECSAVSIFDSMNLSLSQAILRTLVSHSFLEYNERTKRYQYHRLIQEFLTNEEVIIKNYGAFFVSFGDYFIRKLYYHTSQFNARYIESIQYLDNERHNLLYIFMYFLYPKELPKSFLLLALDAITYALEFDYLTCRFSQSELQLYLSEAVLYLQDNLLGFLFLNHDNVVDIMGVDRMSSEYYHSVFIKLVISFSELYSKEKDALKFLESNEWMVELLSRTTLTELSLPRNKPAKNVYKQFPPNDNCIQRLSPSAHLRKFYQHLASHHLALNEHKEVIRYQIKILKGKIVCKIETCTYKDIGYIHWNVNDYEEAGKFFEHSLQNENNNPLNKADILLKLYSIYRQLQNSDKASSTVSQLVAVCQEIIELKDCLLLDHRSIVFKSITVVNQAGKNVTLLEDRMYSVVSSLPVQLQLQPHKALELLQLVGYDQNATKIILWGSLLLKPFQKFNNFSTKDQIHILRIRMMVSLAKLYSLGALNEMKEIFNIILNNESIQKESVIESMKSTLCYYLIPYGRYLYTCYMQNYSIQSFLFRAYLTDFPRTVVYILFIAPFNQQNDVKDTKLQEKSPTKTKAIMVENSPYQVLSDIILTKINTEMGYFFQSVEYSVIVKYAHYVWKVIRFVANVLSVWIRLWIFVSLCFMCIGIFFLLSFYIFLTMENFHQTIYNSSFSVARVQCIIFMIELAHSCTIFLYKLLQVFSTWGNLWSDIFTKQFSITEYSLFKIYFDKYRNSNYHDIIYGLWIINIVNIWLTFPLLLFIFSILPILMLPLVLAATWPLFVLFSVVVIISLMLTFVMISCFELYVHSISQFTGA